MQYFSDSTFHPTFLYELVWDFAAVGVLLLVERRWRIRPPGLFALYVSLYCFGRFWVEALRVDPAHHIGGLRLNDWVAGILFVVSTAFFVWWQWRARKRQRAGIVDPKRPAMAVPRSRVR